MAGQLCPEPFSTPAPSPPQHARVTRVTSLVCDLLCSVGPRLRDVYDNFAAADVAGTAATTGRPALAQYVPGGMGNHYLGYWDVAMGGVNPPTQAKDGATSALSGGVQQLALTDVPPPLSLPPPSPSPAAVAAAFSPAGAMAQYMGMGALFDAPQPASSPPTDAAADGTALSVGATAAAAGAASSNPAVAVYPSAGALGELEDYGEGGVDDGPPGAVAALNMAAAPGGAYNQLQQTMPPLPQVQQQLFPLPMAMAPTPAPQNPYPYGQ